MTTYPNQVIDASSLIDAVTNDTVAKDTHPEQHNKLADEIIAIEQTVGANPQSTYPTVKARLDNMVTKTPTAAQTIVTTGDFTPLRVKKRDSGDVSNLQEWQNEAGVNLVYVDRNGSLSVQTLRVSGALLASTHLVDSAALARLASPAFTGTPTAPTPDPGDNSTKLATTEYIQHMAGSGGGFSPTGSIVAFAATTPPAGWLLCDGSAVSRTTYAILFALIGTTYGAGDGVTTFNVPDMQGRVPVGLGTQADVNALGKSEGITVANRRVKHFHTSAGLTATPSLSFSGGSHSHSVSGSFSGSVSGSANISGNTSNTGSHTHDPSGGGVFLVSNGSQTALSNQYGTAGTTVKYTNTTSAAGGHAHSVSGSASISGSVSGSISGSTGSANVVGSVSGSVSIGGNVGQTATAPQDGPAFLTLQFIIRT